METLTQEVLTSVQSPNLKSVNKSELRDYFVNTWNIYEELFSGIINEHAFYESPDPLRNPLIFYWGHTAVFYINKFILAGVIEDRINPYFEEIFARGVDPDLPENLDVLDLWPKLNEVNDYRDTAYQLVLSIIEGMNDGENINENHPLWSLMMSIEHDRIHFETSSVLIRQLDTKYLSTPKSWNYAPTKGESPKNEMIQIANGQVSFGKNENDGVFGWDNEYGTKSSHVSSFEVSKNMISNSDYLEFVSSGEYNNKAYWSAEGWNWKLRDEAKHPRFWVEENLTYKHRAQFEIIDMPLSWPVELNAHEAIAYCNWKGNGLRLLTENEYQFLVEQYSSKQTLPFIDKTSSNVDLKFNSPNPVDYFEGLSNSPLNDIQGNVWEWLGNVFEPLEGFKTHFLYEDFSAPYFDQEHNMMLGGSWATSGFGASVYYRLWFRRHFYQHAGFRLARSINE